MRRLIKPLWLFLILLFSEQSMAQTVYTRGIGVYPGRPQECYAPQLVTDTTYRNIALNRMVYQSSSYDYNLTGQLITDGIIAKLSNSVVFIAFLTVTFLFLSPSPEIYTLNRSLIERLRLFLDIPTPDVALPCGSRSTSSTFFPIIPSDAATLTAVVVLPTPPF